MDNGVQRREVLLRVEETESFNDEHIGVRTRRMYSLCQRDPVDILWVFEGLRIFTVRPGYAVIVHVNDVHCETVSGEPIPESFGQSRFARA